MRRITIKMGEKIDVKAGIENILKRIEIACKNRPKEVSKLLIHRRKY